MDRASCIDLLTMKIIDPRSIDFDSLIPPCRINDIISPYDVEIMRKTAKSAKLSSKPQEKYHIINDIMTARGFKKVASGTNRVVYKFMEDQRIVIKVAYDSIGMSDSPREWVNQFVLKPYVAKIYEVSPCGTVAMCERVRTITNREEFTSVAEYIFDIICHFVYSMGYVLDDFGSNYFMNWGVTSRGPVLLDYPYLYKVDGKKLFCNKFDPTTYSGVCGGEIDYDAGFNSLVCKKCGKKYLATELKLTSVTNNIMSESKGETNMKFKVMVGNNVVKEVNTAKKPAETYGKPNKQRKPKYQRDNRRRDEDTYQNTRVKVRVVPSHEVEEEEVVPVTPEVVETVVETPVTEEAVEEVVEETAEPATVNEEEYTPDQFSSKEIHIEHIDNMYADTSIDSSESKEEPEEVPDRPAKERIIILSRKDQGLETEESDTDDGEATDEY